MFLVVGGELLVLVPPEAGSPAVNVVLVDYGTLFAGECGDLDLNSTIVHPPVRPFDAVPEIQQHGE